mmetsp:Transcript_67776/g.201633  ORF Transcript_67776/g.201633 Transcript_67776/m.201633 type:complete len:177 (+) Transcript_67776:102-632(+)
MGQQCCQEAGHDTSTVAVGDFQEAFQAECYGSVSQHEGVEPVFGTCKRSDDKTRASKRLVDEADAKTASTEDSSGEADIPSAESTADSLGEARSSSILKDKAERQEAQLFSAKQLAADRAGRVRDLEDRVASLKVELAVANRQLQAVRGDPKTPIWIELKRCSSGNSDSDASILSV